AAAVVGASVIDAYVVARRNNRAYEREREAARATASEGPGGDADGAGADPSAETVRCPACGKETDPTFDFCQWCAEPVSEDGA
ncbi:zinc ribbon domain-containing protein, partial [Halorubrum sp. GN11_10-6_MGM]